MKHSKLLLGATVALGLYSGIASADNNRGFFAGANINVVLADDVIATPPLKEDANLRMGAAELMAGYKYNNWVGVDLRYGGGLTKKTLRISESAETEYKVDSFNALYYRLESTNEKARFYALLGYGAFDATIQNVNNDGVLISETTFSESGASAGLGAGWFMPNNININVECRAMVVTEDITIATVTLGFDYRF